jgi:hypothetical protein
MNTVKTQRYELVLTNPNEIQINYDILNKMGESLHYFFKTTYTPLLYSQ